MTRSFNFMRPFKKLKEDEINSGILHNALFIWGKRPYEQTTYETIPGIKGSPIKSYVSRYEHCFWFDLWLIKGAISWQGRHQNAPKN